MKIYTRGGDKGETSLYSGERIAKDDPRIEALGSLDELVSALGVARAEIDDGETAAIVRQLQTDLYLAMADVASTGSTASRLPADAIQALETLIDQFQSQLPPLRDFLIPGAGRASAALHHARTVCRRAERRLVGAGPMPEAILAWLNRLADLIFVLARWVDRDTATQTFKDQLED